MKFLKMLFKSNQKKYLIVSFLLVLLLTFSFKIVDNTVTEKSSQYMDEKVIYVDNYYSIDSYNNYDYQFTAPISMDKKQIPYQIRNPYESNYKIDLKGLLITDQASIDLVIESQNLINQGLDIMPIEIAYNFMSPILTETSSINNDIYNVKEILVGSAPIESNQVLIGEFFANFLLQELKLETYEELIGKEIQINTESCEIVDFCISGSYAISGIYSRVYEEFSEKIILGPTEEIEKLFGEINVEYKSPFVINFSSEEKKNEFIVQNPDISYLDSSIINKLDYKLICFVIIYIAFNGLYLFIFYEEIHSKYLILRLYGRSIAFASLTFLFPILVFNVFCLLSIFISK